MEHPSPLHMPRAAPLVIRSNPNTTAKKPVSPSDGTAESALKASRHCKLHGDGNHSTEECRTLKQKEKEKAKRKKKKKKGKEKEKEKANNVDESASDSTSDSGSDEEAAFANVHISQKLKDRIMAYVVSEPQDRRILIVDSGASTHMTPHMQWLVPGTFKPTKVTRKVHLGDDSILEGHGTGTLRLTMKGVNGTNHTVNLHHVLLVPDLLTTLISVHDLSKSGMEVIFKDGACKIKHKKDKQPFLTACHLCGLFHINAMPLIFP
jgi:hypothetical protein